MIFRETDIEHDDRAVFPTGVVSKFLQINAKTIINYENAGLIRIGRSSTGRRLFSRHNMLHILIIKYLLEQKDVCFDGIKLTFSILSKAKKQGVDLTASVVPPRIMKTYIDRVNEL